MTIAQTIKHSKRSNSYKLQQCRKHSMFKCAGINNALFMFADGSKALFMTNGKIIAR